MKRDDAFLVLLKESAPVEGEEITKIEDSEVWISGEKFQILALAWSKD